MPKNIATNVLNVDKTRAKTKLRKNSIIGFADLQSEVSQNRTANPIENVEEPKLDCLTDALKFFSHEIVMLLESKLCLKAEDDINTR